MKRSLILAPALLLGLFQSAAEAVTFTLQEASIADVHAAFDAGALTSTKLTQLYLNRVSTYNSDGAFNAVPVLNPDALSEAARLDQLWNQGEILGPLHGIPVVIKDSFNVEGLPTSNGLAAFTSLTAQNDAFSVAKLRDAGAIILGKANMSTWAGSIDGNPSEAYGRVLNPYSQGPIQPDGELDLQNFLIPGGSSSGSGVSVASSFAMLAMGGETGGVSYLNSMVCNLGSVHHSPPTRDPALRPT